MQLVPVIGISWIQWKKLNAYNNSMIFFYRWICFFLIHILTYDVSKAVSADDLDATIADPDPPSRHWNEFRNVPVESHLCYVGASSVCPTSFWTTKVAILEKFLNNVRDKFPIIA